MTDDHSRNPLFIPEKEPSKVRGCPKCGGDKWSGRKVQGVVLFTCPCGQQWQGGLQEAQDPRIPAPVDPYVPPLRFDKNPRTGESEELRRRVDLTQEFRKGAPLKNGDE
jgi:hypothetical protein